MEIPIENLYYLLCYAWDKLEEKDVVDVNPIEYSTLADLFARVLLNGTTHLLKRGFDRGYVLRHEAEGRLKGRVCFGEAIRTGSIKAARLPCDFDELSYNVPHNQILKATMSQLARRAQLVPEIAEILFQLSRRLSEVTDISLGAGIFGRVQLNRNNGFYGFLLKVCELVYHNLLVSEEPGRSRFRDFVRDKRQMAILFEEFVRNFYRKNSQVFRVSREHILWRWTAADQVSAELLPRMQTDISLTSDTRKIIIDCKFTPEATQRHYEAERLRSEHLYQIHAYLSNQPDSKLTETCEVMLLYPGMDERPFSATYSYRSQIIKIRTINLKQRWQSIHDDLLAVVA